MSLPDIKMIVCVDEAWGIGKDGGMLVHLPADLRYFKENTMGGLVIMGRKTADSLPGGKALPGRVNIVLSRSMAFTDAASRGFVLAENIAAATSLLNHNSISVKESLGGSGERLGVAEGSFDRDKVFVIGGGLIYERMLPNVNDVMVTKIGGTFESDTYFPNLDEDENFCEAVCGESQIENGIKYSFCVYRRRWMV